MDWQYLCLLLLGFYVLPICRGNEKVCRGNNLGFHHHEDQRQTYNNLKAKYTNCTIVKGNLELTFLEDPAMDFSFLQHIKEVEGYVLILGVYASYIPLRSLIIIRGRTLLENNDKKYSLYVALNHKPKTKDIGLRELRFTSLYEILKGDVLFYNNNLLCYENTVNWRDILMGNDAVTDMKTDVTEFRRTCGRCHPSCAYKNDERHCWGNGTEYCQKLTKVICSLQCEGSCFGPLPNQCCHPECVGGCRGPSKRDCWACRTFNNNGSCEPYCPPETIYNPKTFRHVPNPNVKYAYGTLCVDKCPEYLLVDKGACVSDCGAGRTHDKDRMCKDCNGPCPKACPGIAEDEFVHAGNIMQYEGCTVIKGSLKILENSFTLDKNVPGRKILHPSELSVFENVQEVTGFVKIQADHKDFTSLAFLRNLKTIQGRVVDQYNEALHIFNSSIRTLDLVSLKRITNGLVFIGENHNLCLANTIKWEKMRVDTEINIMVAGNRPPNRCVRAGYVCDTECSDDGCWGIGDDHCLSCANYRFGNKCLPACSGGLFETGNKTCESCHPECQNGCTGLTSDKCNQCMNVKDGPYCVTECPLEKYPDENAICQACHPYCVGGCTGPMKTVGPQGCNTCNTAISDTDDMNVTQCMATDSKGPDGYYRHVIPSTQVNNSLAGKQIFLPCHKLCKTCNGKAMSFCQTCVYYKQDQRCVKSCHFNYYPNNVNGTCEPCDERCMSCRGPTASDCVRCRQYKVYRQLEDRDTLGAKFNCTNKCPDFASFNVVENKTKGSDSICVPEALYMELTGQSKKPDIGMIAGIVVGALIVLVAGPVIVAYFLRQRARSEEKKMMYTAGMLNANETEPLTPTDARPDMSVVRLIKECELRRGNIIGSGAFGTVYRGMWVPANDNVKIPVAIKVLTDNTSPLQNNELLEEARIMFSVNHTYCVRIMAMCMTQQIMLITQLMPLGCLLDYVRKQKECIGSKVMLNWCTQIAKGMAYLEEKGFVHRDLAARNVLVQKPNHVKITDFGLAKLLDYNQEVFYASGGKMPIKWLALECIQERIFTHKSDVWSYGVTVWEIFTYGQRPYENVSARDIPDLLEKGERLPQPSVCTIDVYMIMIKCWVLEANTRPSFHELGDEFAKMARDPGRYLVIPGDEYLRLPSENYTTVDLLRNMSIADGPEEMVEAEDYLQPQVDRPVPSAPPAQVNGKMRGPYADAGRTQEAQEQQAAAQDPRQARREKKYSGLESAAANRSKRDAVPRDSVNSRYSSDPCRIVGAGKEDYPFMPAPPTPIPPPEGDSTDGVPSRFPEFNADAKPTDVVVQLPVDEDDYLQPQSTHPAAYMDLLENSATDYVPPKENIPEVTEQPPSYVDMRSTTAVQNPEYFDPLTSKTTAQPSTKDTPTVDLNNLKMEKQPLRVRQRSVSTESGNSSEHDYYNESDRLNRSKKPAVLLESRTESRI